MVATIVVVACSQSPEQKAEALVKDSLKKTLFKPDTYKPVDTKLDSAYAPYDDPAFYKDLVELGGLNSEYEDLEEDVKQAKFSMALYGDSRHLTSLSKHEYEEAKIKYEEANEKIENLRKKGIKLTEKIVALLKEEPKFIGYKVLHNYRADTNSGMTTIGNTVFFVDENLTEVKFAMSLEEYNQTQEAIKHFLEEYEESEEEHESEE